MIQKHIHFIGIGGISMSALAKLCLHQGYEVSGSDMHDSIEIQKLKELGATIYIGHDATHLKSVDMVVYSGAIPTNNCERQYAKSHHIPCYERAEFLGHICALYKHTIAIAGTHGKTTTTSMIGWIFQEANYQPTVHIGGESVNMETNMVLGEDTYCITEACEYRNSMQYILPETAVITSIEEDHMDCYHDLQDLKNAFHNFYAKAKVVVSPLALPIGKGQHFVFCGWEEEDTTVYAEHTFLICGAKETKDGCWFEVKKDGHYYGHFYLTMHGRYNVMNALLAVAVADYYEIPYTRIYTALRAFQGVKRRCETLGYVAGKKVIADYAHHPTEIHAFLSSLQPYYPKTLCVFQPHTYSRTKSLLSSFQKVLQECTYLCLLPTYPAREEYDAKGDSGTLFQKIRKKNKKYISHLQDIPAQWIESCSVIVLVGAGDIYEKGKLWLENQK